MRDRKEQTDINSDSLITNNVLSLLYNILHICLLQCLSLILLTSLLISLSIFLLRNN